MDNKQDRQFYWEVKDFMNKNPEVASPSNQKPKITDTVKQVLEQNKIYQTSNFNSQSNAVDITRSQLSSIHNSEKGYEKSCVAYTKNNISNPFQLNERAEQNSFGGRGVRTAGTSWAERNPEAYARNRAEAAAAEQTRAENRARSGRRRVEDEAYEFNQQQQAQQPPAAPPAPQAPAQPNQSGPATVPMVGPGGMIVQVPNVTPQPAQPAPTAPTAPPTNTGLDMDPNDPTMPLDTPGNRAKLRQFRQDRQANYMAGRMEELAGKDPASLTSSEAAELSLFKSMTDSKVATPGLRDNVTRRLSAGAQAAQGPMPDGGNRATDVGTVLSRTLGRSQSDLVAQTQQKGAEEAAAKAADQAAFDAQLATQRANQRANTRIQGTNMTYGEFKQQYNRDFDPLNAEDSSMLVRAASNRSGFRVSPTARALDQTTVDFNRTYRDINAQNADRLGQADRRVDQAQIALDQFNADRRGTVQQIIQSTRSRALQNRAASMLLGPTVNPRINSMIRSSSPRTYRL